MNVEELAAALTDRLAGYEFCGHVLKLTVAEAMQVIEPFLLEQQATITEQAGVIAAQTVTLNAERQLHERVQATIDRLTTELGEERRTALAWMNDHDRERKLADNLAADLAAALELIDVYRNTPGDDWEHFTRWISSGINPAMDAALAAWRTTRGNQQ